MNGLRKNPLGISLPFDIIILIFIDIAAAFYGEDNSLVWLLFVLLHIVCAAGYLYRRFSQKPDHLDPCIPGGYGVADAEGNILNLNAAGNQILGLKSADEFDGIWDITDGDGKAISKWQMLQGQENHAAGQKEIIGLKSKKTGRIEKWLIVQWQSFLSASGKSRTALSFTEITEVMRVDHLLKEKNKQLQNLSLTDGLTEIPNRRYFDILIKELWSEMKDKKGQLSLIMLDIDCFKSYNDTYGHIEGDACLRFVAGALKKAAGEKGTVFRYGGEEFAVLLPYTDYRSGKKLAEELMSAVENLRIIHESSFHKPYVTVSAGIATIRPNMPETLQDFIQLADDRLYESKRNRSYRTESVLTK
ncbi:diguanylate cyclase domain-containing protein [Peribacillus sp. B-H-3]|jgi:diguanylate cyclase (GGDEF)-like protein|uniref:sensor domain-containing diguanylate cyclase n=1 Tax=Peribacillus sp. B-H-3 TaxID=3400420 RepID=UPI003B01F578